MKQLIRKGAVSLFDDRMETICARLCLLSSMESLPGDPKPLIRPLVKKLIENGVISGLVLRETDAVSSDIMERAEELLKRASAVCQGVERYAQNGYDVLLPEDEGWPSRLLSLGESMPLYLFARGNRELLKGKTIAAAGSRAIQQATKRKAEAIGRVLAREGLTLVCGGAQGVDSTLERGVLAAGGSVIIIPAVPAHQILRDPVYLNALDEGRLLILCQTPPDEGFSAPKALSRNHTIYALGFCALVVASRRGKGGSWSGATACIKGGWSPVYALDDDGEDYEGNAALIEAGAYRFELIATESGDELLLQGPGDPFHSRPASFAQATMFDREGAYADTDQA